MSEHSRIQSALSKRKKELIEAEAPCIFCGHGFGSTSAVQLAHLIRKSARTEGMSNYDLQTMKLNTGLAHPECHEIFDDRPESAVNLPRIFTVLDQIKQIDELYYNRLVMRLEPYFAKQVKENKIRYEYRATKESETYIKLFINQDFTDNAVARKINKKRRR